MTTRKEHTVKRTWLAAATLVMTLLLAAPALAHVEVDADNVRPGAQATYTVEVPNESAEADTVKIEVQLPNGMTDVKARAKGWDVSVDGDVLTIAGGRIAPDKSRAFTFTARNPREAGEVTFATIQTYSDGEEARWVGDPGSDNPAPVLTIKGKPVPLAEDDPEPTPTPAGSATAPPAPSEPGDGSTAVALPDNPDVVTDDPTSSFDAILVPAVAAALVLGVAALALARMRSRP